MIFFFYNSCVNEYDASEKFDESMFNFKQNN